MCGKTFKSSKQVPTHHRTTSRFLHHQQSASLTIELVVAGVQLAEQAQRWAWGHQLYAVPPEHLLALQTTVAVLTWF